MTQTRIQLTTRLHGEVDGYVGSIVAVTPQKAAALARAGFAVILGDGPEITKDPDEIDPPAGDETPPETPADDVETTGDNDGDEIPSENTDETE